MCATKNPFQHCNFHSRPRSTFTVRAPDGLTSNISFGTVDRAGCGLTELHNVPVDVAIISPCTSPHVVQSTQIDMFVGSVADGLSSLGGLSAVLSARTQAGSPGHYSITLQTTPVHSEHPAGERVQRAMRAVLNRIDTMTITVASLSPRTPPPLRSTIFTCVLRHRCHIQPEGTETTRYRGRGVRAAGYRR